MTEADVAYLNYRDGGLTPGGGFDFEPLRQAVTPLRERAPVVVAFCEGKRWANRGGAGMHQVCAVLDDTLRRPYAGLPGWHRRGDYGPALVWDPQVLRLHSWTGAVQPTNATHNRNIAEFTVRGTTATRLRVMIRHYAFDSGAERVWEAEQDASAAYDDVPTLLCGDLNSTASGDHLPQRDWTMVPPAKRRHKAMLVRGRWVADTRALDILIGRHVPRRLARMIDRLLSRQPVIHRRNGAGFAALAELAYTAGMPPEQAFRPTINTGVDRGGELIIDWLLANGALAELFVPGSYAVHPPDGDYPTTWPLDHKLITAKFDL